MKTSVFPSFNHILTYLGYWDRPPNFLLVDYYNWGRPNGSVFEVAAEMNGVKWNGDCCGSSSAAAHMSIASVSTVMLVAAGAHFLLSAF